MAKTPVWLDVDPPHEIVEGELDSIATEVAWPGFDEFEDDEGEGEDKGSDLEIEESNGASGLSDDIVRRYLVDSKHRILNREEERDLFDRYVTDKDPSLRDEIIQHNLRLVISIAKRYNGRGLDFLDLIQEGNIGLMKALDKFEPERGLKFSTYATWWIKQSIMRALVDIGTTIRVPVHLFDNIRKVARFETHFHQNHGRPPEDTEVAESLDINLRKVGRIQRARKIINVSSFEDPTIFARGDNEDVTLEDSIGDQNSGRTSLLAEARLEYVIAIRNLERLKSELLAMYPPRDVKIYLQRFGLHDKTFERQTLKEVGDIYGVSRERIRQIVSKIGRKIGKTEKEMRELATRLMYLSELFSVGTIDDPDRTNKPVEAPLVKSNIETVEVSDVQSTLDVKLRGLPEYERKVFSTYYGLEEGAVSGLENTVSKHGIGAGNVTRIIGRVWARLTDRGYKYNEQVLIATLRGKKD